MPTKPTRCKFTIMRQLCDLIPRHMIPKLAREYRIQTRSFSVWSHVVAMMHGQLTHAIGLNDICDALRNHAAKLGLIRGATPPSRNGLSNANKTRPAEMAEALFWSMTDHLFSICPGFGGRTFRKVPRRFKRAVHAVDSTTIQLAVNCIDWAKHRRRKAAAKMHLRLNLQDFLPKFVAIDTAKIGDARRAREACAGLKDGEVVTFDRAYVDYAHLNDLDDRGVFFVSREKTGMTFRCTKRLQKKRQGNILRDDLVVPTLKKSRGLYPKTLRRVKAMVEVKGELREMTFLTNNLDWAASSICDLYRCRWAIETFFKQLKQTLQLCDFVGHSRNAIQWQVWIALLVYLLMRFLAHMSTWDHSFTRIFTVLRSVLWSDYELMKLLRSYGTAGRSYRMLSAPQQAYLPGFGAPVMGQHAVAHTG